MFARSLSAFAVAAFALAPAAPAPVTTKYRVEMKNESVADLTALGGSEQRQAVGMTGYITVTLADTTGGRSMHVVLDSMRADSGSLPQVVQLADSAKGAAWHGFVAPNGRISNLTPLKPGAGSQMEAVLAGFFPRLKPGTKKGAAWTDTLEVQNKSETTTSSTRTITNYRAAGDETRGKVKAMRIDSEFSSASTAEAQTPQGVVNIEGTGKGTGTHYMATDGRYLGGKTVSTVNMTMAGGQIPQPIPVTNNATITVTELP